MHGGAWSPQVDNVLGNQHHLYAIGRPDNLFIFKDLPEIQNIYIYQDPKLPHLSYIWTVDTLY